MDTQHAFVQAILDQPDDDAVRLVYADWLDENGQSERAEFIRVQIELGHMCDDDPRWGELKTREEDLLLAHGDRWRGEFPVKLAGREWIGGVLEPMSHEESFRRGFLAETTGLTRDFVRQPG